MTNHEQHQPHHARTAVIGLAGIMVIGVAAACTNTIKHDNLPSPIAMTTQSPKVEASKPKTLTTEQCALKQPVGFLAGQVLMIGLPADAMAAETPVFRDYNVGGAVLMTAPLDPYDGSINRFKTESGSNNDPLLISTDEEGGLVQRFRNLGILPAAQTVAQEYTPAQAEAMVKVHGLKLKQVGVDMVLGPLADVAPANAASPLGSRVFSSNPVTVTKYDLAYVHGWQAAGEIPTIKHFPGMGSASGNTDYEIATTPPLSELRRNDFVPYRALASSGTAVMVGNPSVPGWLNGPASLSPLAEQYLRHTLGFEDNLVVTDDLAAKAVSNVIPIQEAVVKALRAGYDMPLIVEPSTAPADSAAFLGGLQTAIEQAVRDGSITKTQLAVSVARKLTAQHLQACSLTIQSDN